MARIGGGVQGDGNDFDCWGELWRIDATCAFALDGAILAEQSLPAYLGGYAGRQGYSAIDITLSFNLLKAVAQQKAMRPRYVPPELAEMKRLADEAGVSFRLAKSGCFQKDVDYFKELQISKLKVPPAYATQMTSEQLRDHDAVWAARVEQCDLRRAQARISLTEARAALDRAVCLYREANRSMENDRENPGYQVTQHGHATAGGRYAALVGCQAAPM